MFKELARQIHEALLGDRKGQHAHLPCARHVGGSSTYDESLARNPSKRRTAAFGTQYYNYPNLVQGFGKVEWTASQFLSVNKCGVLSNFLLTTLECASIRLVVMAA